MRSRSSSRWALLSALWCALSASAGDLRPNKKFYRTSVGKVEISIHLKYKCEWFAAHTLVVVAGPIREQSALHKFNSS